MKDLQVVAALQQCRDLYQKDTKDVVSSYEKKKKELQVQLAGLERRDYTEEFLPTYEKVYGVFSRLYKNIEEEQRRTHGLRSHIGDFLKKSTPRTHLNKTLNTNGWVEQVKQECSEAVRRINTAASVEAFDGPIKQFCQAMADMKYICDNATKLLRDCGLYQGAERQATAQTKDLLRFNEEQYAEKKKFENLPCYPALMELKAKLEQALQGAADDLLQNGEIDFGCGYEDKVLMGFSPIKEMTADLVSFARERLGVDITPLHQSPVFFPIDEEHSSIIFEMDPEDMTDKKTTAYMEKLLFSFLTSSPCQKLSVSAIECKNPDSVSIGSVLSPVIRRMEDKLGKNPFVFTPVAKSPQDVSKVIGELFSLCETRAEIYDANGYSNIFEYNRATPDNQHSYHLLLVNNYPFGFESVDAVRKLKALMQDCTTGVIVVVFQSAKSEDYAPRTDEFGKKITYHKLDAEECQSDLITRFDQEESSFLYNGKVAYHNITLAGFDPQAYWADLNEGSKKANILYLDAMLEKLVAKGAKYSARKSKLRIPIGQKDGEYHDFVTDAKDAASAIILGGVGSGKSSFLHTLILSAAYLYSPEEVEFYITDFKSADKSADFVNYREGEKLYLPHVKYLSMKSTAENAFDILDMIEDLHNKRQKILADSGVVDVANYNSLPEVESGQKKPMSRILFFIDEYLAFLNGGAGEKQGNITTTNNILTRLSKQLIRVRSSGICIVLCGQYLEGLGKNDLGQIGTRIGMKSYSEEIMQFTVDELGRKAEINKALTTKGMVLMSSNNGLDKQLVRFAFSGDTGKKRQVSLAEKIRAKWQNCNVPPQVVAGSTAAVPITGDKDMGDRIREDAKIDPSSYVLYLGQTSASSAPVGLRFSNDTNAMGYYACMAGSDRLRSIERAVLLAFLETTATRGITYSGPRITYCWKRSGSSDELGNCLAEEMQRYGELSRHIQYYSEEYEAAKSIMGLYSLFKKRKSGDKSVDRTPRFLLIHNPEWLSTVGWAKEAPLSDGVDKKQRQEEQKALEAHMTGISKDAMAQFGGAMGMLAGFKTPAENAPKAAVKEVVEEPLYFAESEVKAAVKDLYNNGHKENIFLLITTENSNQMYDYIQAEGRQEDAQNYRISDTFGKDQKQYPRSCCHVRGFRKIVEFDENGNREYALVPVSSKTRMYLYDTDSQSAWWDNLVSLLSHS